MGKWIQIGFIAWMASAAISQAQTNNWIDGSSNWEAGTNWSLGIAPSATQSAIFLTNAGFKVVTLDAATAASGTMTISNLTVSANSSTNTLFLKNTGSLTPLRILNNFALGKVSALVMSNSMLSVDGMTEGAFSMDGALTLFNSCLVATNARMYFASDIGQSATLTVTGGTNQFLADFDVASSIRSTGAVFITGGQFVATNYFKELIAFVGGNGAGRMVVSGGSALLYSLAVGFSPGASGTLTVQGGSVEVVGGSNLFTTSALMVGVEPNSKGSVQVSGGQFVMTNGTTALGMQGTGEMKVYGDGAAQLLSVYLSPWGAGTGLLSVASGKCSIYSNLVVGYYAGFGRATVNIDGGELHVTNSAGTAALEITNGTLTQNGGVLDVDHLVITNWFGRLIHNSGTLNVRHLTIDPNLDADGDGIPNGWEQEYGLDPLSPNDANADPDGDGKSNLQEFLAGTDPTNRVSAFQITAITREGNDIRVTWMTGNGKTNALEAMPGRSGGYWANSFATIFTATNTVGSTTNYLDVGGATNFPARYYRARLVQW